MSYQIMYADDGSPYLVDEHGARVQYGADNLTGLGIGVDYSDGGRIVFPHALDRSVNSEALPPETINSPAAMTQLYATENPDTYSRLTSSLLDGKIGGSAGLVAPGGYKGLFDINDLFQGSGADVYGVDVSQYRKTGFTPEELSARQAFLSQFPGYAQVSSPFLDGDTFRTAGPGAGNYIIDTNAVKYDPTYGYITPTSNFGFAGEKGGFSDATIPLAMMLAAGVGSSLLAGAGGAAAGAPTFAGGASGAGIAGAAGGGGSLAGLTAAEMAAIGAGGAGASGALAGGGEFVGGASGGGLSGGGMAGGEFLGGATGGEIAGGATGGALSGAGGAAVGGAASGATSALGRILGGNATSDDWLSVLGAGGSSLLGVLGSNAQADAYGDVASQYLGLGAPFREKLLQSYDPGFSMADQPDFQNALDIGAQAAARATSARSGNPVDNPGAYSEMQKYISGSLALPQLNTYRSQLGSFGQLGTNTAGTASMGEASQTGGMYDALGYGLGKLTQPKNPYEDMMKGLLGGFKLNTGTSW